MKTILVICTFLFFFAVLESVPDHPPHGSSKDLEHIQHENRQGQGANIRPKVSTYNKAICLGLFITGLVGMVPPLVDMQHSNESSIKNFSLVKNMLMLIPSIFLFVYSVKNFNS